MRYLASHLSAAFSPRRRVFASIALVLSTVSLAIPSSGQSTPQNKGASFTPEFSISYNYLRANAGPGQCGCFSMNGGNLEAAFRLGHSFSFVGEAGGEYTTRHNSSISSLTLLSYTGGPRYTGHYKTRYAPFVQALFGGIHGSDSYFPHGADFRSTANSFALSAGGGMDVRVAPHWAWRALQADYMYTQMPNNQNDHQNLLRISTGLVWRFAK